MYEKILLSALALGGAAAITLGSIAIVSPESNTNVADRVDCPGKIVCPLTGDQVCKDRCPLDEGEDSAAANTAAAESTSRDSVPPCCANLQDN